MSEREKMLSGEYYDCGDAELLARWHEAKRLQQEYNTTASNDMQRLDGLLDRLVGRRGANVWIAAPFFVDYGGNIYLGDNVEIKINCAFLHCKTITIENRSGIGSLVHI